MIADVRVLDLVLGVRVKLAGFKAPDVHITYSRYIFKRNSLSFTREQGLLSAAFEHAHPIWAWDLYFKMIRAVETRVLDLPCLRKELWEHHMRSEPLPRAITT